MKKTDKIYVWSDDFFIEHHPAELAEPERFGASTAEEDPYFFSEDEPGTAYLRATPERLAAEDMLKALRASRILLRSHCQKQIGVSRFAPAKALKSIEAAIAKAEGWKEK